jgi:DNA-binding NtrC family response regulator
MQSSGSAIKILLVDDDRAVLEEIQDFLSWNGLLVTIAASAAQALQILAAQPDVTVLLTDLRMPFVNGLSLLDQALRGRGEADAIEVVLMTGHGSFGSAAAAVRAGAFGFLRKPMVLSETLRMVQSAHARAVARRTARVPGHVVALGTAALN